MVTKSISLDDETNSGLEELAKQKGKTVEELLEATARKLVEYRNAFLAELVRAVEARCRRRPVRHRRGCSRRGQGALGWAEVNSSVVLTERFLVTIANIAEELARATTRKYAERVTEELIAKAQSLTEMPRRGRVVPEVGDEA